MGSGQEELRIVFEWAAVSKVTHWPPGTVHTEADNRQAFQSQRAASLCVTKSTHHYNGLVV